MVCNLHHCRLFLLKRSKTGVGRVQVMGQKSVFKLISEILFVLFLMVGVSPTATDARIMEYTDNEYNYTFQFPSDWTEKEVIEQDEFGEIRVLLQGPRASSIMVLVNPLGKGRKISKEHFNSIPNRNSFINQMINFTVDQIYRTTSKRMNASKMIVIERQIRPSESGIKFYISTLHFINDVPLGLAGIHTVPFGQDYLIGFVMSSILDSRTMEDNETFKHIFNSFRLIGEEPASPSSFFGGVLDSMVSWMPLVGGLGWKYNSASPLSRNIFLWLPLGVFFIIALKFRKIFMRKYDWKLHKPH